MKRIENAKVLENNRILLKVYDPETKRIHTQLKRVPADFPLSRAVREAYRKGGERAAITAYEREARCSWLYASAVVIDARGRDI